MKKLRPDRLLLPALAALAALLALAFFAGRQSLSGLGGLRAETERPAAQEQPASRAAEQSAPEDGAPEGEKLDLNRATREDLIALPGIGETLADRILEYRRLYGPFTAVEQLLDVEGIGEAKLLAIRDNICVEEANENSGSGR